MSLDQSNNDGGSVKHGIGREFDRTIVSTSAVWRHGTVFPKERHRRICAVTVITGFSRIPSIETESKHMGEMTL